jgi:hypothetical protein
LNELEHTAPQVGISNCLAEALVGRENTLGTTLAMMTRKAVLYFMMEAVLVLTKCYDGSCCLTLLRDVEAKEYQLLLC